MFMKLFDQQAYKIHQKRALGSFHKHDFLFQHVGYDLTSRLQDIKRNFKNSLNLSPHPLNSLNLTNTSLENFQDFPADSFDLIFSCLLGHSLENLPEFLRQVHRCLQPDGLFLAAILGGNTLVELRDSLLQAELSMKGGASPRVSPMVHPKDATQLLSRAGFILPVVDTETITVTYPTLFSLMRDLRGMGETNILNDRVKSFTPRGLFEKAEEIYRKEYGFNGEKLPATFEVIYLTGWGNPQA